VKLLSTLFLTAALALADDAAIVRASVEKFNAAAKAGDAATLKTLLHDGLLYVHSNGKPETKAEAIAAIVKTPPNFVFDPGWTVTVHGKTAIVSAKATNNPGTPGAIHLHMMQTWVNEGGWKMVGRHTGRQIAQ
jgi:ketosteroid isomerase-like protein